jgi:hypothetical protein
LSQSKRVKIVVSLAIIAVKMRVTLSGKGAGNKCAGPVRPLAKPA